MKYKQSTGSVIFDMANIILMLLLISVMLYPFLWVLSTSISDPVAVAKGQVKLLPRGFDMSAYKTILRTNKIAIGYKNSIIYTVLGTLFILVFTSVTAYPLSRGTLYGRRILTFILALTMILPAGMIPKFLLIKDLHMLDTLWAMVIPPMFSIWYIILVRTNFQALPDSLIDSAKIDGASEWRVLFQIVIPLSKPILATIALFAAVNHWNEFFSALLYLNDAKKYPLQMVLRTVLSSVYDIDRVVIDDSIKTMGGVVGSGFMEKVKMAIIITTIGPIILVYPFAQKYFIKGTLVGSVKG